MLVGPIKSATHAESDDTRLIAHLDAPSIYQLTHHRGHGFFLLTAAGPCAAGTSPVLASKDMTWL